MSEKNLKKEIEFIKKNKNALLNEHENKYLLIYQEEVISSFDTYENAAEQAIEPLGSEKIFLIYHLTREEPLNFVMEAIL